MPAKKTAKGIEFNVEISYDSEGSEDVTEWGWSIYAEDLGDSWCGEAPTLDLAKECARAAAELITSRKGSSEGNTESYKITVPVAA